LDQLDALSLKLVQLRKQLIDATPFLPSYDQQQYETQLRAWEQSLDTLRNSYAPKAKFAFKRRERNGPAARDKPISSQAITKPIPLPSSYLTLSSHSQSRLSFSSLPNSQDFSESDLTIADLDNCIVDLVGQTTQPILTAIHIRNISDTILVLPIIKGSVLLHDIRRCIIVVGCHQFRMHTSTNVHVHLAISSNPVIEHCSGIRFTNYPAFLSEQSQDMPSTNNFTVQDFSHIRASQSPNWSAVAGNNILDDFLKANCPDNDDLGVTLEKLLPSGDSSRER